MVFPKLVCLCGYKGTGKDTAADFIKNFYNYEHKKIAGPIKEIVKYLFLLSDQDVEENKEILNIEWNVTPRLLMQKVGTELFQHKLSEFMPHIGNHFWIIRFIKQLDKNQYTVISDMRFYHEYKMLKDYMKEDMIVIKIENDRIPQIDNHISELEFNRIDADYIIKNDTNIMNFYDKVNQIFSTELNT
jgi:dephospho-CoA kinase